MIKYLVIGAGVVGGMIARELTRYSDSVHIVDRAGDVAMGATRANSAIVHAGFDCKVGTMKAKMNVRGSEMMGEVCRELGVKYKNNGSLVVGFNEEDETTLAELYERGVKNGVKDLAILHREELLSIEPNIGEGVTVALYAKTGAIVCPYELCMAAIGCAMDNGAGLTLDFEVVSIEKTDEGYLVTAADGRTLACEYIINAAGAYSDEIARMMGDESFDVHPRRGEYLLFDREFGSLVSHTIFRCPSKMGKGVLVTPTVDGNLLVGPTAEDITDKADTSTTAEGQALVRKLAAEQVCGLPRAGVITSFTGLRSVGSTGDFIIKREGDAVTVAAIESPGLSSAPAIAEYVAELLGCDKQKTRADFNPVREAMHAFSEMTEDEKNEVIRRDPTYAHIVCRCEGVSEGEILHAIRTNPRARDVDGVKRRTRASMGRCQGCFCTPYIVELLAREWGIAEYEVTKFGGGSYMNVGKTKGELV